MYSNCHGQYLFFSPNENSNFHFVFKEPYVRRCANTRLMSAEKLMYICKNQLGNFYHLYPLIDHLNIFKNTPIFFDI